MATPTPKLANTLAKTQGVIPEQFYEEKKKRMDHYVWSAALDLDFTVKTTRRRLSNQVIPRGRITILYNLYYPTKDRSEEAFKNGSPDRMILWEKTAKAQATELISGYNRIGLVGLDCLTGKEPELVQILQDLLLPESLWKENERGDIEPPDVPALLEELEIHARERLKAIADHPDYPLAEELRQNLVAACMFSLTVCNEILDKTEMELEKARSGQKAKASLDPLDRRLYKALGRSPRVELLSKAKDLPQPQNIKVEIASDPAREAELLELKARLADLEKNKQEAAAGKTKPCPRCAEDIKAEALFCRFCQFDLTEPPKTATPTAPKRAQGQQGAQTDK